MFMHTKIYEGDVSQSCHDAVSQGNTLDQNSFTIYNTYITNLPVLFTANLLIALTIKLSHHI